MTRPPDRGFHVAELAESVSESVAWVVLSGFVDAGAPDDPLLAAGCVPGSAAALAAPPSLAVAACQACVRMDGSKAHNTR